MAGQQFEYGFDHIGNRTQSRTGGDQNGWNLRTATYTANLLNQYSHRTVPGYVDIMGIALAYKPVTVNGQVAYRKGEYFRRELTVNNNTSAVWQQVTVQAEGEPTVTGHLFVPRTPEQFTYDLDGNLTADGRWSYAWDAENRLVRVESRSNTPQASWSRMCGMEWTYDGKGRRVRQKTSLWTNSTWIVVEDLKFISDPMSVGRHIAELNATNNSLIRSYIWGLDLSGSLDGAGGVGGLLMISNHQSPIGTYFACYDGNGNVVALSAASNGSESARYEYGPFAEPIRASGPAARSNPFRFSTKRTDNTTDFVLYEYRVYSPSLGRWLSRDPIGEWGGLNLYGFVGNDPLQRIDPDGRAAVLVIGGVAVTVADCAILATLTCLAIPPCRDALINLVKAGVRAIGNCCRRTCPPCTPYAKGTTGYIGPHETSPNAPPEVPRPYHYHLWIVNQQPPPTCHCYWNRLPPHYHAAPGQVDLNKGFPKLSP